MNLCNKETGITTVSISVGGNVMNTNLNITSGFCESCVSYPTTNTALALSAFCVLGGLYGKK